MPRKRVLLLVEDDSATRYVMGAILQGMGSEYEIVSESSHDQATTTFGSRTFDLMITDLVLRSDNGVSLTREVRARSPNMPVIWITGFGCELFEKQAQELNVFGCLDKPASAFLVRSMVRKALEEDDRAMGRGDLEEKDSNGDE